MIESLYHAFKRYGNSPIPLEAATDAILKDDENQSIKRLLDKVWDSYAKYTPAQLSTLTHQANTPWSQVYDPNERFTVIPDTVIAKHYKEKIDAARKPTAAAPAAAAARY